MKKYRHLFLLLLIASSRLFAQGNDKKIDDLIFMYVDEKYDKVVYKGEALMQNDKYRKHPLIYIYTSMSYYEMSRRPGKYDVGDRDSKFPKPLKMAQKHLYKFVKTDKKAPKYYKNSWYEDFKEYYVQIADTSNRLAQYLYLNDKYRKAASMYKIAFRAVPNDPVLQLWQGIGEVKSRNAVEGDKTLIAALKKINKSFVPSKATSGVLAHGMLIVEEYWRKKGNYTEADKAKKLIDVFKKYDPDELDKKKMEERKKKTMADDRIMRKFYSDEEDEDNKDRKGKVIIKDGRGSSGNGTNRSAEEELDRIERLERKNGGK
jgi:tetratricopeptide (TPR) repeat protein